MMVAKGNMAVVFWGPHSMSSAMFAQRLNAPLYLIHYLSWKRPWVAPFKYPPMWLKTWWILFKQRPSAVLVINTPVFAPLCVYIYCLLARIPFAMNVHGHTLSGRRWGWSRPIQRYLAKRAAVNLVGTVEYKQILESWNAKTVLLEYIPTQVPSENYKTTEKTDEFWITVVNTFAGDEPLEVVLEAARQLPNVCFYVTGETALAKKELLDSATQNVIFTGYLKGATYWEQLFSSNAVMTLTTNPHSLVAGGSEGMYMGKPLILSNQPALTEYFSKGAVFVEHTAMGIVEGVRKTREQESKLAKESKELAIEKQTNWEDRFSVFYKLLGGKNHV